MKSKRVVVPFAQVNSMTIIEIDPSMQWVQSTPTGQSVTHTLYPIDIQIVNDCNAGIEFNPILNVQDYEDYKTIPLVDLNDYYALQRLPKNGVIQSDHTNFPRCYKFLVRGYEASANKDLIIEFLNYR